MREHGKNEKYVLDLSGVVLDENVKERDLKQWLDQHISYDTLSDKIRDAGGFLSFWFGVGWAIAAIAIGVLFQSWSYVDPLIVGGLIGTGLYANWRKKKTDEKYEEMRIAQKYLEIEYKPVC